MNDFDWDNSFLVDFDLVTGLSKAAAPSERRLSKMKDMFHDTDAAAQILEIEDPILYRWFELGAPERAGDLAFGVTILVVKCRRTPCYFHTVSSFHWKGGG